MLALSAVAFSACANKSGDFVDKIYIYEKLVAEESFTISINADGTFEYSLGPSTGNKGTGTWTYSNGELCLTETDSDGHEIQNYFQVFDGCLIFVSEGSSNFTDVTLNDAEIFFDISAK